MPSAPEIFEICIQVTAAEIDSMQHVNNVAYVRWVQDVAVAHWRNVATPEEQQQWLWVVLRHEIDYKHPAVLGERSACSNLGRHFTRAEISTAYRATPRQRWCSAGESIEYLVPHRRKNAPTHAGE